MKIKFFEIKNFKGIDEVRIDFESHPQSNVYTLVGLNESGKTTFLEALNFFIYKSETLDPLNMRIKSRNVKMQTQQRVVEFSLWNCNSSNFICGFAWSMINIRC